jgi:pimeloyl-ACP methyl ester carboxylesterase
VEYDLSRLRLPVALFYGGKDTVIDIDALVKELPNVIKLHKEDEYEHLDCIWADSALTRVFPQVHSLPSLPSGLTTEADPFLACISARLSSC